MIDLAAIVKEASGDRDIRQRDIDQRFATPTLSDTCIDAANRAAKQFDPAYPGWALYSRIVRGDTVFDRQLAAWAISCARRYARARKVNGRQITSGRGRRNDWIVQAAIDALEYVIDGRWYESADVVASRYGKSHADYQKFRATIATMMLDGFENYQAELHYQYHRVRRDELKANYFGPVSTFRNSPVMLGVTGIALGVAANGCYGTPPASDSDNS